MVTAVLHPQDVLAPSQVHPNCRLSMSSEWASAAALATPASVCHGISLDCVGRSSFGATEIRGVLSRKDSSAGLLPLPDHVSGSTHTSAKFAPVRGRGSSRGSLPSPYRKSRFPVSTDEHAVPLQRRPIFDLDPVSLGRRRPACVDRDVVPARLPLISTHGCMASPSISVPDEVLPHPRIAPMAKTSSSHLYDTALPKWSEQPKVPLLSEATHLGSRGAKQSNNSTFKSSSALSRRHGGSRLLNRSASEEKMELSAFTRPSSGEVAEKLPSVHSQSRRENDRQQGLPACPALPMHCGTEAVLERLDLASDTDGWLSMIDERWAGPSFFNSPPPSALPVPTFTSKLLRTTSTSPEPMNGADRGSPLCANAPVPDAKRTWDVAFATKDLRRLLHLDHARCDA